MQNRIPDANKRQPIPITRSPTAVLVIKVPIPTLMQAQAATINVNTTTPDTKIAKNGNKITTSKILNTPLAAVMINGERNTRAIRIRINLLLLPFSFGRYPLWID